MTREMPFPTQMERARAARALLKDARQYDTTTQREEELAAFMTIFHPGVHLELDEEER